MQKKKWGAFPRLSEQVGETGANEFATIYRERVDVVEYHLDSLALAARQCTAHIDRRYWHMQEGDGCFHINVLFDPLDIARVGDLAIREAASVIDTSLLVMNHVLALGLAPTLPAVWRSKNDKLSVRAALVKKLPDETALLSTLDAVYGSIGYYLLNGYRNWVTHRGSPRVVYATSSSFPGFSYNATDEIVREQDPRRQEWLIDRFLNDKIWKEFTIQCWPFVPPVQEIVSGQGQDPELIKRGINVSAGIVVQNARFVSGSLTDDAKSFLERNPIVLEAHRAVFAGEALAVYSPSDYTMAVGDVEHFVTEDLVRGKWDDEIASAYARLKKSIGQ